MAGSGTAHLRGGGALTVENLTVEFPVGTSGDKVHAVSNVSFDLMKGETLGVVGESGCGKSTTGKAIMRVPPPTSGSVRLGDTDLASLGADELRTVRGQLQMIFQDPISSLNPRRTIRDIVAEPLTVRWLEGFSRSPVAQAWEKFTPVMMKLWKRPWLVKLTQVGLAIFFGGLILYLISAAVGEVDEFGRRDGGYGADLANGVMIGGALFLIPAVIIGVVTSAIWLLLVLLMIPLSIFRFLKIRAERSKFREETDKKVFVALEEVGIPAEVSMTKYPHEFSGGQAQRISIARALVLDPEIIICDEPVSALDVSVQAQVLNLLEDLKASREISLIFIAHDLAVVKNISDRVVVMYLGKVCEVGQPDQLYAKPRHPYTRALMSAIPVPDPLVDPRGAEEIDGELPSPIHPPSGCRFRTRCSRVTEICATTEPMISEVSDGQFVACHHPLEEKDWHLSSRSIPVSVGGGTSSVGPDFGGPDIDGIELESSRIVNAEALGGDVE